VEIRKATPPINKPHKFWVLKQLSGYQVEHALCNTVFSREWYAILKVSKSLITVVTGILLATMVKRPKMWQFLLMHCLVHI